ncbi:MAG: Ig-like domain-containing protein [Paludibacteraceae bacterium]|nr:Ig-like domain-containing protein [Paludibacteraceae bacterium]
MKRTFSKALFASVLIATTFFVACKDDKTEVNGVKISPSYTTANVGEYIRLYADITPENADNKEVRWECDETYLENEGNGFFHAIRSGQTTVFVTTVDGNYKDSCRVAITDAKEEQNGNIRFRDDNLRKALVNNSSINIDEDDGISHNEAKLVKKLNVANKHISSFDELSYFTNLEELYCEENQITSLNVSSLTKLKLLSCQKNQLSKLDISQNTELTTLLCFKNDLKTLDIRNNTKLEYIYCGNQSDPIKLKLTTEQFNTVWKENLIDVDNINVNLVMNFFEGAVFHSATFETDLKNGDSFSYNLKKGEFPFRLYDSEGNELSFYDPSILRQIVWTSSNQSVAIISAEYEDEEETNTAKMTVRVLAKGNTVIRGTVNDEYTIYFNLEVY